MRWFHEMLFPAALLITFASFWVAADAKALEQRASQPMGPQDPVFARHVMETYCYRPAKATMASEVAVQPCAMRGE